MAGHGRGETNILSINQEASTEPAAKVSATPKGYKWIALSNTTLGTLVAIFTDLKINPLAPDETSCLLWVLMGYMLVMATLLVSLGRLSDMFGRVRLYNLGFAVFTLGSIQLFLTPGTGNTGALDVIFFRLIQGVGAGFPLKSVF